MNVFILTSKLQIKDDSLFPFEWLFGCCLLSSNSTSKIFYNISLDNTFKRTLNNHNSLNYLLSYCPLLLRMQTIYDNNVSGLWISGCYQKNNYYHYHHAKVLDLLHVLRIYSYLSFCGTTFFRTACSSSPSSSSSTRSLAAERDRRATAAFHLQQLWVMLYDIQ